jgi:hypothetical protein
MANQESKDSLKRQICEIIDKLGEEDLATLNSQCELWQGNDDKQHYIGDKAYVLFIYLNNRKELPTNQELTLVTEMDADAYIRQRLAHMGCNCQICKGACSK